MERVSDCLKKYKYIDYEITIDKLVKIVDWSEISCIAVHNSDNKIFGILSEQDIVQAVKEHKNLNAIRAWEICTHKVISISKDATVMEAAELMIENHIHHLSVNDGDKTIGLISSLDLLKQFARPQL